MGYLILNRQLDRKPSTNREICLLCNNKLKVYPNPVSNVLTIEAGTNDVFQILNLLGQQVLSSKAAQRIDVSALPQGSYVLKVGSEQVKFMKQ